MGLLDKLLAKLTKDVLDGGEPAPSEKQAPPLPSGTTPVEVYRHNLERLLAAGDAAEFATFTDAANADRWVQVLFLDGEAGAQLNFQYPYAEEPTALVAGRGATFPDGCEVTEWEADFTAMVACRSAVPAEVAAALDALYRAVHGIEGDYEMHGDLE